MKTNFDEDEPRNVMSSLAAATLGEPVIVTQVDAAEPLAGRLADLGLLPETRVTLIRRAPLGDPVELELRGYRLCLRIRDASRVQVRPAVRDTPPGPVRPQA